MRTAGLSRNIAKVFDNDFQTEESPHIKPTRLHSIALLDVGFGCGDQTAYLTFPKPVRASDEEWWDEQPHIPLFQSYYGITKDVFQYRYAMERKKEFEESKTKEFDDLLPETLELLNADACFPKSWYKPFTKALREDFRKADERWVLALDCLYHFWPDRWGFITYAHDKLHASFMAFDLCLTNKEISWFNRQLLWILSVIMGATWDNFVITAEYRKKLVEIGYDEVEIRDVSEYVFAGLEQFVERQGRVLEKMRLGLSGFQVAKWMFGWWAKTGLMRGVIVVARHKKGLGREVDREESPVKEDPPARNAYGEIIRPFSPYE